MNSRAHSIGMAAPRRLLLLLLLLLPLCAAQTNTQEYYNRLYLTCHAIPKPTVFHMGKCYVYVQSNNDCRELAGGRPFKFNYVSEEIEKKLGRPEKKRGYKMCEIGYEKECSGELETPFGCYSTVRSDSLKGAEQKCVEQGKQLVAVHSDWDIILLTQFAITKGIKALGLGAFRDHYEWMNTDGSEYDHHRFQVAVDTDFLMINLMSGYFMEYDNIEKDFVCGERIQPCYTCPPRIELPEEEKTANPTTKPSTRSMTTGTLGITVRPIFTPKPPFNYKNVELRVIYRYVHTKGNHTKTLHEFNPKRLYEGQNKQEGVDLGSVVTRKGKDDMERGGADPAVMKELQPWNLYQCAETTRLVVGDEFPTSTDEPCKHIQLIGYGFRNPKNFKHVPGVWETRRVDEFRGKRHRSPPSPAKNDWHYVASDPARMACAVEFWHCKTGSMAPQYDHTGTIGHVIKDARQRDGSCTPTPHPPQPFDYTHVDKQLIKRRVLSVNRTDINLHEFGTNPTRGLEEAHHLGFIVSPAGYQKLVENQADTDVLNQLQEWYLLRCRKTTRIMVGGSSGSYGNNELDESCATPTLMGYGFKTVKNMKGFGELSRVDEFRGKGKADGDWFYTSSKVGEHSIEYKNTKFGTMAKLYDEMRTLGYAFPITQKNAPQKPFNFFAIKRAEIYRKRLSAVLHRFSNVIESEGTDERSPGNVVAKEDVEKVLYNGAGTAAINELLPLYLFKCKTTTRIMTDARGDQNCRENRGLIGYGFKNRENIRQDIPGRNLIQLIEYRGKAKAEGDWMYTSPSSAAEYASLNKNVNYEPSGTRFFLFR